MAVLSRRCGWLEPDEREEIFQDAYLVVLERERDGRLDADQMVPAQLRAFLVQTAINKALDEGKRVGRSRSVPLGDAELDVADGSLAPEDVAAAGLEGARVREIVGDLSERKRAIVKLRFFFDRSPDEIQSFLGITERVYRRDLERAMRQIHDGYELVREGSYCDSRRSGIIALVSGIAGPARAQAAREHLSSCPSCAAWASQLREDARKVGALAPLPDLLFPRGPLEWLANAVESLRDAGAGAKQHASALATRLDQASAGTLAVSRPGAAATVLAGCLAIGGGATYCVVNGVPEPLRGVTDSILGEEREPAVRAVPAGQPVDPVTSIEPARVREQPASEKAGEKTKKQQQRRSQRQQKKAAASAQVQSSEPAPAPEPAPEPEPVPEEEFGFEGEPAPAAPAPAPSSPSGGGEFGP